MPAKSKQQLEYIYHLRDKYGSKSNTPKDKKWIWKDKWTNVDYKNLPQKKESKSFIESILDPVHDELNPKIWNGMDIIPSVRAEIFKILYTWLDTNNITDKLEDINFLGSNAGYQYGDTSDIDINVLLNITDEEKKELTQQLPNGNLLPGTHHPINYYILNESKEYDIAGGSVYNLITNEWIIKPQKNQTQIPFTYIIETAKVFMKGIDDRIAEYERDVIEKQLYEGYFMVANEDEKQNMKRIIDYKENEIMGDLEGMKVIWDLLHTFRYEAFGDENPRKTLLFSKEKGNISVQNQIYKIIEKFGYHEKLIHYTKIRKEKLKYD